MILREKTNTGIPRPGRAPPRRDSRDHHCLTNSFVTAPIARAFGIEHLIATDPEARGGEFTGGVQGIPCFREGKVTRLEEWIAAHGESIKSIEKSTFYSDSHNDLPLLERVTHPVAVDPDEALRAQAVARGWPVMSLG